MTFRWIIDKEKNHALFINFSHGGKRRKFFTGIHIPPSDQQKGKYRFKHQLLIAGELNQRIEEIELQARTVCNKLKFSNKPFSVNDAAKEFERWLRPARVMSDKNWKQVFSNWLIYQSKTGAEPQTVKIREPLRSMLISYEQYNKTELDFSDFNAALLDDFYNYMIDVKKYEVSYVKKRKDQLMMFIRYMIKEGLLPEDVSSWTPKRKLPNIKKPAIFVYQEALEKLIQYQPLTKHMEKIKDAFLVMCASSLRHSDSLISETDLRKDSVIKTMKKTDANAEIPRSPLLNEILTKYGNKTPKLSLNEMNTEIKKLFKAAEIDYKVKVITTKGGIVKEEEKYIYDVISTKAGRKTFVSLGLAGGLNEHELRDIGGWKRPIDMDPYVGVEKKPAHDKVKNIFKK